MAKQIQLLVFGNQKVAPSVTYGTKGVLKFQDSSSLGDDSSGNNNDFTLSGNGRQILDTPSNVFCTSNNLTSNNASISYTQGNTTLYKSSAAHAGVCGNLGVTAGKWYWEVKLDTIGSAANATAIGVTQTYTHLLLLGKKQDIIVEIDLLIGFTQEAVKNKTIALVRIGEILIHHKTSLVLL